MSLAIVAAGSLTVVTYSSTQALAVPTTFAASPCTEGEQGADCRKVYTKYLNPLISLLSAAVGILAVTMIIVGGVQYSSAGSDPQQVAEAKSRIIKAVVGLVSYVFLFGILNWLVPGGLLP